ncbi:MAG: hypothetical protein OQJ81_09775 [Melioribacteraceae bacterium]|nr:hypothetical protein [Melioribacteraceae bacterium]
MGQQQLLLIVLVMILVGAAILVGMQVYDESIRETAITTISKDLISLSTIAINYYKTPIELGGGGQSFTTATANGNWKVPDNLDTLDNRAYSVSSISKNSVEILGQSIDEKTGLNGSEGVKVYITLNQFGANGVRIEN